MPNFKSVMSLKLIFLSLATRNGHSWSNSAQLDWNKNANSGF